MGGLRKGEGALVEKIRVVAKAFEGYQIFVMIHGFESLFRAAKNAASAETAAQIRAQISPSNSPSTSSSTTKTNKNLPKSKKGLILRALEGVKISVGAFVVMTENMEDVACWILEMTLEIGVRPYKLQKHAHQDRHHLTGVEPKGKSNQDTFIKMLSSLSRVTEGEAEGIVGRYGTLKRLYEGWEAAMQSGGEETARAMLVGCAKGRNLDGTSSGRKMGKEGSRKLYEVMFGCRDPDRFANA